MPILSKHYDMTESEININAFRLVDLITEEENNSNLKKPESENIVGVSQVVDFGKVKNFKIIQKDLYGNVVARFIPLKNKKIGLNIDNYKVLQNLCSEVLSLEHIAKYADNKFVEASCFEWLMDVYDTKQAKHDLLTYIKSNIENELDIYTFYYKIECLGISSPFIIGNVKIDWISQDFLDKQYNLLNAKNTLKRDEFDENYKDFFDKPIASIQIRGLKDSAESFAREKVKLALNAIKCFLIQESIQATIQIFDVDFLFHNASLSNYLFQSSNKESYLNLGIRQKFGVEPTILDMKTMNRINNEGLNKLSEFLNIKSTSELSYLIEDSINRLGEIISTRDWHERVVKIISFFESVIVPKTNTKANGETYLKKNILVKLVKGHVENIKRIIRSFYNVRDKYIHNRISKPIDINELYKIQRLCLMFLLQMIDLNKNYSKINDVLNYYGIEN